MVGYIGNFGHNFSSYSPIETLYKQNVKLFFSVKALNFSSVSIDSLGHFFTQAFKLFTGFS